MAAAGKNVIAFALGPRARLAARAGEEAHHRRARADPVPRHLPRAPGAARHRARLRDAAAPRGGRRRRSSSASRRRSASCPCSLFLFEGPGRDPDAAAAGRGARRGGSAAPARRPPSARRRRRPCCASTRWATARFFAMRCGGELVGALGVGLQGRPRPALLRGRVAADGRARPGEPGLRERPPLRRAGGAARGDPHAPGVPGERHPLLLLGHRRARRRGPHPLGEPRVRAAGRPRARTRCAGLPLRRGPARRRRSAPAAGERRRVALRDAARRRPTARSATCSSRSRRSAARRTAASSSSRT